MNFGLFAEFRSQNGMTDVEIFDESFKEIEAAE